jgi:hypothetical protein
MSNNPWRVKPSEIARTVKSVRATGLHVRNIEVTRDGTIRVSVGELPVPHVGETTVEPDEWD